jgi:hypothetical protein
MPFNGCSFKASFRHPFLIRKHYTLVNLLDQLCAGVQTKRKPAGCKPVGTTAPVTGWDS